MLMNHARNRIPHGTPWDFLLWLLFVVVSCTLLNALALWRKRPVRTYNLLVDLLSAAIPSYPFSVMVFTQASVMILVLVVFMDD